MNQKKHIALMSVKAIVLSTITLSAMATDKYPATIQTAIDSGLKLENNFDAAGDSPVDDALKAKVDANAQLMEQWGFSGTPVLLYRDKEGKVRAKAGMPLLSELPSMTGLAEQANNDPALAKYR